MRSSRQFFFLNGPNKLVFVRMYGSTITGLVGPPYPYLFGCSILCFFVHFVIFCAFFVLFLALMCAKSFRKKENKEFNTTLITPIYNLKLSG